MPEERKRVLLIEDDTFLSNFLKVALNNQGVDVVLAKDGEEAMESIKNIKEIKPSLILLDLVLPKKSGFEVLEEISTNIDVANIPVVIISQLGQTSDIEKGKSFRMVADYLIKSNTSLDELVEKIKGYLNK
jgi:DNA-binding response OmpR family regulator